MVSAPPLVSVPPDKTSRLLAAVAALLTIIVSAPARRGGLLTVSAFVPPKFSVAPDTTESDAMVWLKPFNESVAPFGLVPTKSPEDARGTGRYALENDEHVDVLVARSVPAGHGEVVSFDGLWQRRRAISLAPNVEVLLPTIPDLILTKRIGLRPKDLEDIRLLEILQEEEPE